MNKQRLFLRRFLYSQLISQFILVIVLSVLVAILIFEVIGKPFWPGPDVSKLQSILEQRLPTSDVLKERHRELIGTLRSSPPNGLGASIERRGRLASTVGTALLVMGSLAFVGAFWSFRGGGQPLQVGALFSVGTLISSLGGVTLLKGLDIQLVIPPGASQVSQVVTTIQHGSVGPFDTGKHILESHSASSVNMVTQSLLSAMCENAKKRDLLLLFIVGSADKRPLTGELAMAYGSNAGLAQARAEWVRDQILSRPPSPLKNQIITTIRGPSRTGSVVPFMNLSDDRQVQVYGLWRETQTAC